LEVWGNCYILHEDFNIEDSFVVNGDRSDTGWQDFGDDPNNRNISLNLRGNNYADVNRHYMKGRKVWILSHGWNGQLEVMNQIGDNIKNDSELKNDVVLVVDWREASHTPSHAVCAAATWTRPTAEKIVEHLNKWGLTTESYDNVRLVGHSMGTILNTEIGIVMHGKPEMAMHLDPPSDTCPGGYNVEDPDGVGNETKKSDLWKSAQKSRSFVGAKSSFGSQEHNRTADLSFQMDFWSTGTSTHEHGWVQNAWRIMLDSDRLDGDTLGARDVHSHSNWKRGGFGPFGWQGNHGVLKTRNKVVDYSDIQNGDIRKLRYRLNGEIQEIEKQ